MAEVLTVERKPIVAILAGHHGRGTGASTVERDEWELVRKDAGELFVALQRDSIVTPMLEPYDDDPKVARPIERAAKWCIAHKADVVVEFHYNSFSNTQPAGHCVVSNKLTPFVETMADALDVLPNKRRSTIINEDFILPRLLGAIPCVLLEPAFIFEDGITKPEWRPMLVSAVKSGLYKYFAGGE